MTSFVLDLDFATTVLYHLRYELLFSALFAAVLFLSPGARSKVVGTPKGGKPAKKERELPKDPLALAEHIIDQSSTRYSKAVELFLSSGPSVDALPDAELVKVVSALAVASVRVGRPDRLPVLFQQLRGEKGSVLVHVMRLLAARQQHNEALTAMSAWRALPDAPVPAMAASCLVQCAVEARKVEVAEEFFALLKQDGCTSRDYSAMIRLYAATSDAASAKQCLADMKRAGFEPDNVAYNMVLAAQAAAPGDGDDDLHTQMASADVVTFNTRLKACARAKDVGRAFAVFQECEKAGLTPTQVTYGTLLECCSRAGDLAKARAVLSMMDKAGVAKNNIVYTSMIKGLVSAGQLKEAMQVFGDMRQDKSLSPDVICYSVLIKGHCDHGELATAIQLLEDLLVQGQAPDEILFNNLLAGCAAAPNVLLGEKLLADMVLHRIRPTMATFSILLKMYSKAGSFAASADLLQEMPDKYGVVPAARLYVQHISWCIRLRRGASALQVFRLLLDRCSGPLDVDPFLSACCSFNMLDTACSLVEAGRGRFSAAAVRDLHAVLAKKKPALAARVEKKS